MDTDWVLVEKRISLRDTFKQNEKQVEVKRTSTDEIILPKYMGEKKEEPLSPASNITTPFTGSLATSEDPFPAELVVLNLDEVMSEPTSPASPNSGGPTSTKSHKRANSWNWRDILHSTTSQSNNNATVIPIEKMEVKHIPEDLHEKKQSKMIEKERLRRKKQTLKSCPEYWQWRRPLSVKLSSGSSTEKVMTPSDSSEKSLSLSQEKSLNFPEDSPSLNTSQDVQLSPISPGPPSSKDSSMEKYAILSPKLHSSHVDISEYAEIELDPLEDEFKTIDFWINSNVGKHGNVFGTVQGQDPVGFKVKRISRIQNLYLWGKYHQTKKDVVMQNYPLWKKDSSRYIFVDL